MLKSQNTISNQNQTEITGEKELPGKIRIYVNKLNSTANVSEQSFGKNQLIKLGKKAVPYLEDYLKNDKRIFVKVQIGFVLEKIKDKSVIPILEKTATSKYIARNKSAIIAIGNIGGDKAVNAIKRLKKKVLKNEMLVQIITEELMSLFDKLYDIVSLILMLNQK